MVKSSIKCGIIIENSLKRTGMLAISKFNLSEKDLLDLIHESTIEIARKHFDQEKENYYETRPVAPVLNGKFSDGNPAQTGTGTVSATAAAVLGVATVFSTQLVVGDKILVAGQLRTVSVITDNLNLTVSVAFSPNVTAGNTFTYGNTASYDSVSGRLTFPNGMSPSISEKDINKVITFFDKDNNTKFVAGVITAYISGTPKMHEITPFNPVGSITNVSNITIGDWLVSGDVITLTQGNNIFSPENISLYDTVNKTFIEMVSYKEFDYRKSMAKYQDGSTRYCRYKRTSIEFAAGSSAPTLGTLRLSGYWEPKRPGGLNSPVYASDTRLAEIEDRLCVKLTGIKLKSFVPQADTTTVEVQTAQLRDEDTVKDQMKAR